MLDAKIYEEPTAYRFVVSDGTDTFVYCFGRDQDPQVSKREALLLAEDAISKKVPMQELDI